MYYFSGIYKLENLSMSKSKTSKRKAQVKKDSKCFVKRST